MSSVVGEASLTCVTAPRQGDRRRTSSGSLSVESVSREGVSEGEVSVKVANCAASASSVSVGSLLSATVKLESMEDTGEKPLFRLSLTSRVLLAPLPVASLGEKIAALLPVGPV